MYLNAWLVGINIKKAFQFTEEKKWNEKFSYTEEKIKIKTKFKIIRLFQIRKNICDVKLSGFFYVQ